MKKIDNREQKFKLLLKKLKGLREENQDSKEFYMVTNTIKEIDDLGLNSTTFIDEILEVLTDKTMRTDVRRCLPYVLRRVNMEDRQIVKICSFIKNENYPNHLKDGLMGTLSRVVELDNPTAIETLYTIYKDIEIHTNEKLYEIDAGDGYEKLYRKISIAKELVKTEALGSKIKEELIANIENDVLPLPIKLNSIEIMKEYSYYDKRVTTTLIEMIRFGDFSGEREIYDFEDIINNFLGMNPSNSEMERFLFVIRKNKSLYCKYEWLVDFLNKLKLYPNKIDFFIEVLYDKHEGYPREDEASALTYFRLSLEHTNQLLDYLEENREDVSKQSCVIYILKNMPNYNLIDLDRLSKIYQFEGLSKKVYRGIKDILKERKSHAYS